MSVPPVKMKLKEEAISLYQAKPLDVKIMKET